jgi:regulator of RNase E activity RraA
MGSGTFSRAPRACVEASLADGRANLGGIRGGTTMSSTSGAAVLAVAFLGVTAGAEAQLGLFTNEQRLAITSEWKGERFPDARPKVADSVLERMKAVTAEEAWGVLVEAGYRSQFESGWKEINGGTPGRRLVGRVVTAVFVPARPDLNDAVNRAAKSEGRVGRGQNSWVIDTLQPNDVLVVDLFGKIDKGTFIGDNLGTSIFTKTGTGVVVNGSVRDVSGLLEIKGFLGYARDFHPTALADVTLAGINVPIRIGGATVMPGDVVLGDPEGLTFIPPQLAEKVVVSSEDVRLRDDWGHEMLRQGKYTPGQVDARWTPEMEAEFEAWAKTRRAKP